MLSMGPAHLDVLQKLTSTLRPAGLVGHLYQSLQGDVTYRATEVQALTNPAYAPVPAPAYAPAPAAWLPLPAQPQVQVQIQLQGSGLVPLTPQLARGVSSGLSTLFRAFNINFTVTGMVPSDGGRDVWPAMQLQLAAAAPMGMLPEPGSGMPAADAPSAEPEAPAGLPRPRARLLPETGTSMAAAAERSATAQPPAGLPRHTVGLLPEAAPQPGQPVSALRIGRALQAIARLWRSHPAPINIQPTATGAIPEPAAPLLPATEAQQPHPSPANTAPTGFVVQAPHAAQPALASLPDIFSKPAHPEAGEVPRQRHRAHPDTPLAAGGPTAHCQHGVAPAQPKDSARGQDCCTPTLPGPEADPDAAPAATWTAANLLSPSEPWEHQPPRESAGVPGLSALLQPGSVCRRLQAAPQPEQAVHGQAGRAGLDARSSTQEPEVPGGEAPLQQAVYDPSGRAPSGSGSLLSTRPEQQSGLAGRHLHSRHVPADQQADTVSLSMYRSHVNGHRDPNQQQTHHQAHPRTQHSSTSSGSPHPHSALARHRHWQELHSPAPDGPSQSPAPGATSAHLNFTQLLSRLGLLIPRLTIMPPHSPQAWTSPPDFRYLPLPEEHHTSETPISDLNHHSPPQPSQIDASPPILGQLHTARVEPAPQLQQAPPQPSLLRSSQAVRILLQQAAPSLTPYINVTATLSPSGLLLNKEQPVPVFASMAVDSTRLNMAFVASLLHADGLPVEKAVFLSSNLPGDSSGEGFMPCGLCCYSAACKLTAVQGAAVFIGSDTSDEPRALSLVLCSCMLTACL